MGFAIHWHESAMGGHVFPITVRPLPSSCANSTWDCFQVSHTSCPCTCCTPTCRPFPCLPGQLWGFFQGRAFEDPPWGNCFLLVSAIVHDAPGWSCWGSSPGSTFPVAAPRDISLLGQYWGETSPCDSFDYFCDCLWIYNYFKIKKLKNIIFSKTSVLNFQYKLNIKQTLENEG